MLPRSLSTEIESVLGDRVIEARALGGGCIAHATRITTAAGLKFFLKYGARGRFPAGILAEEARSLELLKATHTVRVPGVVAVQDDHRWLMLEWLEPAPITRAGWENLARTLARLHASTARLFGWPASNFIGSLSQSNEWTRAWPDFWRDERIRPQLERAARAGLIDRTEAIRVEMLLRHTHEILAGDEPEPAFLHGDLWSGNVHGTTGDTPAVIDPSSYYGHREVDLAMADLFGGFDPRFFEAYDEALPRASGYQRRRHAYQLYYLLVHVNLFGRSYLGETMSAVGKLGF